MRKSLIKTLDARLGPCLVALSRPRATRREQLGGANRPLAAGDVARMLLIRPGGIGDALLSLPLLQALRGHFPSASLTVLAERRNAGGYTIEEHPPEILLYDERPWETYKKLTAKPFDLVVDTEQFHHFSTLLANRLAPRYLCGYATLGRGKLLTHSCGYSEDRYEVDSFLDLFETLTGQRPPVDPDAAFLRPATRFGEWADKTLGPLGGRPLAAVTPGAGSPHRLWPARRYAAVAAHLAERDFAIVILGGGDAIDAAKTIAAALPPGRALDLAGKTSLGQTAAALARCRLLLTPDTGTLHVARAVGTPTLSLFGSGRQKKWGPPGRLHIQVMKGLPCSPCTTWAATPPCPREYECMDALAVEDVIAPLDTLLERIGT